MKDKIPALTPAERRVMEEKDTERPFTGKYYDCNTDGVYLCRKCGKELFRSSDKFDSRSGWPSFDEAIQGAVTATPDPDGVRTEVACSACGAHLGHVFMGEGFTPKNVRYCINSITLSLRPDMTAHENDEIQRVVLASGCFWGTEYWFSKLKGVLGTRVGYAGGWKRSPLYIEVRGGQTGHRECVEVTYDPSQVSFEDILRLYFNTHDPQQTDGQGPDLGPQYLSAVFYTTAHQRKVTEDILAALREKGITPATELRALDIFYPENEEHHQHYYDKKGSVPYCHIFKEII